MAINKGDEHPSVIAFYDDDRRTIFLTEGWSAAYPKDVSVLVHEMVHHLQNLDGSKFACPAERERLAFRAQDAWLKQFQTTLANEFAIDPMTPLVRTNCMH